MAHNNLVWIKGDITDDIYYDIFSLDGKEVQYLRLFLTIQGEDGAGAVKGMGVCFYGPLAELVYRHARKGSRLGVFGHIQQSSTPNGNQVFEIVADDIGFLSNMVSEAGEQDGHFVEVDIDEFLP